jgi:hypothetical protein
MKQHPHKPINNTTTPFKLIMETQIPITIDHEPNLRDPLKTTQTPKFFVN